jgi:hypothetical protein
MKRSAWVGLAGAMIVAGCASMEQQRQMPDGSLYLGFSGWSGEIKEQGMACTLLDNARIHEDTRNNPKPTQYELAALANVPGCILVTQLGRKVTAQYQSGDGQYLQVVPDGNFNKFWIPARMLRRY